MVVSKFHDAVLELDPRTVQQACRVDNGPRIKSEGSPEGSEISVLNGGQIQ